MRFGFCPQIREIDVAIFQTTDSDNPEPSHDCARWIRSMGRGRDQTNIALRLASGGMIFANREQSRIFALRPGIRLQGNGREPGDLSQPALELLSHFAITLKLVVRREGVNS